ncbi:MAG: preQ(1) synthase [Candidatus Obscuribacterales bacterium]|nr:preQ(1) synthase [Candidatus Obscuribacterales bacterium]
MQDLKHLGNKSEVRYTEPDATTLEWVPNPFGGSENPNQVKGTITICASEFTSLCPITGQPDFGIIEIEYVPHERLVESKSLKLYLGQFRQQGEFHEACINRIANDLVSLLQPELLVVTGKFTARGGITIHPRAEYRKN